GLAGSALLDAAAAIGLPVAAEAFADRRYLADGSLQSRREAGAVIGEAGEAAAQALGIVRDGIVVAVGGRPLALHADTLCLHGDGAHAVALARQLREALEHAGVRVAAPEAA
ncbi:MAG: LamB/YcsF family protein, partial [Xanthomonadaceae bacterium]|nr:LamB/YcsF family protein [Xanthomonadaceae bacterium]